MKIATGLLVVSTVLAAAGAGGQAPAAPPKPLVPIAANTLATNPEPIYGEVVSVTATVEHVLSPSAFTVDQDRTTSSGHDVLVIAPTLTAAVEPDMYVTVVGEAVRFDPREVARRWADYTLDLGPDVVATYQGRPAILARAVVNTSMVDLARRPPPPMSPEEEAYDRVMKRVGPAFADLRTAVAGSDAAAAAEGTKVLKAAFAEVEDFWAARKTADAIEWARTAQRHLDAIEGAAGAGDWDQIRSAAGDLGQTCQACHSSYRDQLDDGTYRIRSAAASR